MAQDTTIRTTSQSPLCQGKISDHYTIRVRDWGGTGTGGYRLYIQRLNNPVGCRPIAYGALPLTGSITMPAEGDCYTFVGAAGDQVRVRVIRTSGNLLANTEVLRPDGTTLCRTPFGGELTCRLDATGTYTSGH